MTDSQFEKLLSETIQKYGGDYIEIPKEMWKPHRFSITFEKRMRQLLWKERGIRPTQKRIPLRMLIIVIITAILTASAAALSVSAFREAIVGFITDIYNTFTNVQAETDENAAETLEEIYEVTWVPDGFELVMDDLTPGMHRVDYRNDEDYICFKQFLTANYSANYDIERSDMEYISIYSMDGFWIPETQVLVWKNDNYVFEIILSIESEQQNARNAAVLIAKSVQKVESQ